MGRENRSVILITGGTGAIGSATVEIAAKHGMRVYFTGTSIEKGTKLVKELKKQELEVTFVQNHVQSFEEAWDRVTEICLDGLYHMTKVLLDMLKESENASIINIGSVTGLYMGLRNQCAYNVCKALIHNMTRGMAIEYGKYDICVNAVIPGSTMNPSVRELFYTDQESTHKMLKHIPLERVCVPADIGEMIVHLAEKESNYVNGCLINIDGGWAAGYSAGK